MNYKYFEGGVDKQFEFWYNKHMTNNNAKGNNMTNQRKIRNGVSASHKLVVKADRDEVMELPRLSFWLNCK